MSAVKLKLTMYSTLALIIGFTTLIISIVLSAIGAFSFYAVLSIVLFMNVLQWLLAPYIIEAIYRVREADPARYSWLYEAVRRLARKSRIEPPKLMISSLPIPNAFAYGSPLTGNRIAVTEGLLRNLDPDEVEAVIGHEIGHLVHRDVHIMMLVSIIPAILYYIGRSMMWSSMFYGGRDREERGGYALLGLMLFVAAFILNLMVLGLSRLREYYADRHSASIVENGAVKLQVALAKIVHATSRVSRKVDTSALHSFRALLIADPATAHADAALISGEYALVKRLKERELTFADLVEEMFSTHPNIVKRLKALDEVAAELGQK